MTVLRGARPNGWLRPGRAATAVVDHVMADPGAITLVAVGPLTRVAVALALEPASTLTSRAGRHAAAAGRGPGGSGVQRISSRRGCR